MHFPRFGLDRRTTAITLVLVSSAFVWYFLVFDILQYFLDSKTGATVFEEILFLGANVSGILVLSANVGAIVFAAIVGTLLIDKFKKRVSFPQTLDVCRNLCFDHTTNFYTFNKPGTNCHFINFWFIFWVRYARNNGIFLSSDREP